MDNKTFISENLELMEKQLRYSLRIVSNLQTLLNNPVDDEDSSLSEVKVEDSHVVDLKAFYVKELIIKYFSSNVINGGEGYIQPNDKFKQYSNDLLTLPIESIDLFPIGFYINDKNKFLQFLLEVNGEKIIIDEIDNKPRLYITDRNEDKIILKEVDNQTFIDLLSEIEKSLTKVSIETKFTELQNVREHGREEVSDSQ